MINENNELISVIMSIYNESIIFVKKAVESILQQTYENIEYIIIIDNPDNYQVIEYLEEYCVKDSRIKLLINEFNIGLAKSLNRGIELCRGKYIVRMDADDISIKDRIEKQIKYLKEMNLDMVSSLAYRIDEKDNIWGEIKKISDNNNIIMEKLKYKNVIIHPSVIIKTEVIRKLNGYRNFDSAQDYDLWLRMISSGYKIGVYNEKLIYFRFHKSSITSTKKFSQFINEKYIRKLYKERIEKYGEDSFSDENLKKFLQENNYYNENYANYVNYSFSQYRSGVKLIKSKRLLLGSIKILHSIFINREVWENIYLTIRYKVIKNN